MGNLLPARIVSALSVALYGMFLAIIVPPAKENRVVLGCVLSAFAASAAFAFLPVLRDLSTGNRTIILTVVICGCFVPAPGGRGGGGKTKTLLSILTAAVVTYLVRVLPLTLIRKPIRSRFLRSFLYYVPYVTLAVMTFPAIVQATEQPVAGAAALVAGILIAWRGGGLITVAASCCGVAFVAELLLGLL